MVFLNVMVSHFVFYSCVWSKLQTSLIFLSGRIWATVGLLNYFCPTVQLMLFKLDYLIPSDVLLWKTSRYFPSHLSRALPWFLTRCLLLSHVLIYVMHDMICYRGWRSKKAKLLNGQNLLKKSKLGRFMVRKTLLWAKIIILWVKVFHQEGFGS